LLRLSAGMLKRPMRPPCERDASQASNFSAASDTDRCSMQSHLDRNCWLTNRTFTAHVLIY
jgi:hypothetical protein